MSVDTIAAVLVLLAAPPATLFPLLYVWLPWWRSAVGRALMVSSTGLALLIDVSLARMWLGEDYPLRDAVRLTVYTLITVGVYFKLAALLITQWKHRHNTRSQ